MELYYYDIKAEGRRFPTQVYSPPRPMALLLEQLSKSTQCLEESGSTCKTIDIRKASCSKLILTAKGQELLGEEPILVADTSVDEVTGKTLYHHYSLHDGKWSVGRIAEILVDEVISAS